jgi:hypothetical protein
LKLILNIFLIFVTLKCVSQISGYTFSTGTTGSSTNMTGETNTGLGTETDAVTAAINIGFNFIFAGTTYTQFKVNTAGMVCFGNNASFNTSIQTLDVAGMNLITGITSTTTKNQIYTGGGCTYLVTGVSPNRKLTIQFYKLKLGDNNSTYIADYQIQLFETTNVISYVYSYVPIRATFTYQIGISSGDSDAMYISDGTSNTVNHTATASPNVVSFTYTASDAVPTALDPNIGDGSERFYTFTPPPITDDESIIDENGFDEPDNIAYSTYTAASGLTNANSIKVGSFVIIDGGADITDADSYSTILNSVTFTVYNSHLIKALAVFDGASNLSEQTTISYSTTFSGLTLTASDNGTKSFDIYATFKSSVTDNAQVQFTISNTTSSASGSNFATANAGGALTSIAGDDNRLEVTATKLTITADSWSDINTNFNVFVYAMDANNNVDLDNSSSITLTRTVGSGVLSSVAGLTQSLVSGYYAWSDCQSTLEETITIQAAGGGLTAGTVNVVLNNPTVYYVDDGSNTGDVFTIGSAAGNDATADGKNPLTPYASLNGALSVATAGDIIKVDNGTFNGGNNRDKTINIAKLRIIGAGMDKTIFNNGGTNHYFVKITANDVVLQDFTLDQFDNVVLSSDGHALTIDAATGVKVNFVKVNNSDAGSGKFPVLIRNNAVVTFNGGGSTCNAGGAAGGAIQIEGASTNVSIKNYILTGNATNLFAGAAIQISAGILNLRNSYIYSNETSSNQVGPGLYQSGGTVNVFDCVFEANKSNIAGTFYGGQISVSAGTFNITRSIIKNNVAGGANTYGGGIGVAGGTATVDSCLFSGNTAFTGKDIAIDGGTLLARNCRFNSTGVKIFRNSGTFTFQDCGSLTDGVDRSGTFTINNTNNPTYTAAPSVPTFTGSCATSLTMLPIELLSFSAICKNGSNQIFWQTASETNNEKFQIFHSLDGENFKEIAEIKGAGTSSEVNKFNYSHINAPLGKNYYKLRQIDFDGNYTDSKVVVFDGRCANLNFNTESIYYNAVNNMLNLTLNSLVDERGCFSLLDVSGRIIFKESFNINKHTDLYTFSMPLLSNGVYLVTLSDDGGGQYSQKIVINR